MTHLLVNPITISTYGSRFLNQTKKDLHRRKVNINIENIIEIIDLKEYLSLIAPEDEVYILGGDETFNMVINSLIAIRQFLKNKVYFVAYSKKCDFVRNHRCRQILLNSYSFDIPYVEFQGIKKQFSNTVGMGFDGFVCYKRALNKDVKTFGNVFSLIFKSAFKFKPSRARVIVDGMEFIYNSCSFATICFSPFFAHGIKIAPEQNNSLGHLTAVIGFNLSPIKMLFVIILAYFGLHVKLRNNIHFHTGIHISIEYEKPQYLQNDEMAYKDVTKFEVNRYK
jgi:diacylglycerol kinase family enzyme